MKAPACPRRKTDPKTNGQVGAYRIFGYTLSLFVFYKERHKYNSISGNRTGSASSKSETPDEDIA